MSIILEKPAVSEAPTLTISVPMAVTRDMVAAVVDLVVADGYGPADGLTPEFIRESVEVHLRVCGVLDLEESAKYFTSADDGSVTDFIAAVYRAADRAFPELAPAVTA
ncbi:hypothetical protein [Streptomyces coffeae]|uniref:Uncharacterized protein n=1 Tax=Streptomyces coffeae TaxID=621382 RepID=A0ABS1NKR1_9ACTN|nr:hypothetical protein [Streptomyces coffeae]MBL1100614.1 hypothetical protein [Streptomyces coffeae]